MRSLLETTCPHMNSLPVDGVQDAWAGEAPDPPGSVPAGVHLDGLCDDDHEKYPRWLCAAALVAYCGVFWAGVITVGGWIVAAVSHVVG
jgi:hypothetical protein